MTVITLTVVTLLLRAAPVTGYCAGLGANPGFRGPPKVEQVRDTRVKSILCNDKLAGHTDQRAGELARPGHQGGVRGPVHRQVLARAEPQRLQNVWPPLHLPVQLRGGGPLAKPGLCLPG